MDPRPINSIKEITVLSIGDPGNISTWSNVPYFFSKHLEKAGCKVNRVNIGPVKILKYPYDLMVRLLHLFGSTSEHDFFRSRINDRITHFKIGRAIRKYPKSLPVFTTFSFGAARFRTPYVLFCDRTFEHHIAYFNDRPPSKLEQKNVLLERRNLENATMIISLFPEMADSLAAEYGDKVKYYENVVNMPSGPEMTDELFERKWNAKQILFIGKAHYKEGLIRLLEALKLLNHQNAEPYHLHVIGLNARDVPGKDLEHVSFHGYLNKSHPAQFRLYTQLLSNSFLFINPNPRWAAFSASCEAMYYGCPLIIHSYLEFVSTFGDDQRLCWFIPTDRPEDLVQLIRNISNDRKAWEKKALNARKAVEPFSWSIYVAKVVNDLEKIAPEL